MVAAFSPTGRCRMDGSGLGASYTELVQDSGGERLRSGPTECIRANASRQALSGVLSAPRQAGLPAAAFAP